VLSEVATLVDDWRPAGRRSVLGDDENDGK